MTPDFDFLLYNVIMKIAICDDNKIQLHMITQMLDSYVTPGGDAVRCDVYENALDLLSALPFRHYDALLMDILMPGFNGIEAARDIRKSNEEIPIIFLTSSPEFAVESYRVHAFDYLMKPVDANELFKGLDRIFTMKKECVSQSLTIHTSKAVHVIPLSKLEYVEINNRTLLFHLSDGDVKPILGRLSDYEERLLSHPAFLKVHRSYVVNMELMKALNKNSFVTMTGKSIPISRNLLADVQNQYMNYLHSAIRL